MLSDGRALAGPVPSFCGIDLPGPDRWNGKRYSLVGARKRQALWRWQGQDRGASPGT